jgi:hypothetical protein
MNEDLRKWFGKGKQGGVGGGGWDRYDSSGNRIGKCGDAKEGDPYSACLSKEKAEKLGKEGRAAFVKRKRAAQSKGGDSKKGGEHTKGQKPIKVKTGINEIGDSGASTYPFTNPSKGIYRFKSDSDLEYRVELEERSDSGLGSTLEISYRLLGDMYNMVTNKGEQFRVMATLIETVKDYLKDNPQVKHISFVPVKSFDRENDNRRANLYMAYVKKQLPGATVKIDGNRFTIDLPEKLPESKINEIGDASVKPYDLKLARTYAPNNTIAPDVIYNFTTDSGLKYELALSGFEVQTANELTGAADVSFKMEGGTYTAQTNAGEQFKIMATVVDAVKKYLKDNPKVSIVTFVPVKSRGEGDQDNRREKMYLAYVKKQIPNAEIDTKPYMAGTNKIIIKLPKQQVGESKINEIGDSTAKAYNFKLERHYGWTIEDAPDATYSFETDSDLQYKVNLFADFVPGRDRKEFKVDVSFRPVGKEHWFNTVTNKGEQFRIMATVIEVIKEYIKDYPKVTQITFTPAKTKGDDDRRRANLYLAYVKKQLPDATVTLKQTSSDSDEYIIDLPKQVAEQKNLSLTERLNLFLEKNIPTDPAKWSYYKAQAKKKFDVYPSAYANGWAAKKYKEAGGGWRKSK